MKIVEARNGVLTNFEVLQFLQSKGARKDHTRVVATLTPSELKVYDYLELTAACSQTKESIKEFVGKCKRYNLKKAEIINIINVRPSSVVEVDPIIEECDTRLGGVEELVEMVIQLLPSPPTKTESNDGNGDDKDENPDEQRLEAS